jgi:hypothetical protein
MEKQTKIAELLSLARQKEEEAIKKKELEAKGIAEATVAGQVEKIYADRESQVTRNEDNNQLKEVLEAEGHLITAYKQELAEIPQQRQEVNSKLTDKETPEEAKAIYEQILRELENEETRLNAELAHSQGTSESSAEAIRSNNEFINNTTKEAAEILGYGENSVLEVLKYIKQQRAFAEEYKDFLKSDNYAYRPKDKYDDSAQDVARVADYYLRKIIEEQAQERSDKGGYVIETENWGRDLNMMVRNPHMHKDFAKALETYFQRLKDPEYAFQRELGMSYKPVSEMFPREKEEYEQKKAALSDEQKARAQQQYEKNLALYNSEIRYDLTYKSQGDEPSKFKTIWDKGRPAKLADALPPAVQQLDQAERREVERAIENPGMDLDQLKMKLSNRNEVLAKIQQDALDENAQYEEGKRLEQEPEAAEKAEQERVKKIQQEIGNIDYNLKYNGGQREQAEYDELRETEAFFQDRIPLERAWESFFKEAGGNNKIYEDFEREMNGLQVQKRALGKPGIFERDKKKQLQELETKIGSLKEKIDKLKPLKERIDAEAEKFFELHPTVRGGVESLKQYPVGKWDSKLDDIRSKMTSLQTTLKGREEQVKLWTKRREDLQRELTAK